MERFRAWILLLLASATALAWQSGRIVRVAYPETGLTPAAFSIEGLLQGSRLSGDDTARRGAELAVAAQACLLSVLNLRSSSSTEMNIEVFHTNSGDVVHARATCSSADVCIARIADTPESNLYELQLPSDSGSNDAVLTQLFRFGDSSLMLKRMVVAPSPSGGLIGYGEVIASPTRAGFGLSFLAEPDLVPRTLRILLGKNHCRAYYPVDAMFLARRFPSLLTEARQWSKARLVQEAGMEVRAASLRWERNRLDILLRVLGERTPAAEDVATICTQSLSSADDRLAVGLSVLAHSFSNLPEYKASSPRGLSLCAQQLPAQLGGVRAYQVLRFLMLAPVETDLDPLARRWLAEPHSNADDGVRAATVAAFRYLSRREKTRAGAAALLDLAERLHLGTLIEEDLAELRRVAPGKN